MRKPFRIITLGLALCGLILSGCSAKEVDENGSADAGLPAVSGEAGGTPKIDPGKGAPPTELTKRILLKGDGAEIKETDFLVVNYAGQLWDGTPFDSSFEREDPAGFSLQGVIKGWTEGLTGTHVGDRVQLVIPSELGYGEEGNPPNVPGNSTLVFVVDVISAVDVYDISAFATANTTGKTLPGVSVEGQPGESVSISQESDADAPTETSVQILAEGAGEPVGPDDFALYHSTYQIWGQENGGSSYEAGPTGVIATDSVLSRQSEQMKKILLGQKVGSRVLVLVPAQEANQEAGQAEIPAHIQVIDIVAKAYGKAK